MKYIWSFGIWILAAISALGAEELSIVNARSLLVKPEAYDGKKVKIGGVCKFSLGDSLMSDSSEQLAGGLPESVIKLNIPIDVLQPFSGDEFTTTRGAFILFGTFTRSKVLGTDVAGEIDVSKIEFPFQGEKRFDRDMVEEARRLSREHHSGKEVSKEELIQVIEVLAKRLKDIAK